MNKKLISAFLAGIMTLSLAACGSSTGAGSSASSGAAASSGSAASGDDIHISVVLKTTASEHWQLVMAGCKQFESEHEGLTIDVTGPASETSYDDQQNMIETSLNNKDIDALIIAPLQSDVAANLIAGETRPVFALDTNISAPEIVSFIGTGNEEAAKQGAALAVQAAKDAGWETIECIEIAGVQGDATNTARMNGYMAGVEAAGGDFLENEVQYATAVADQAVTCMEAIMQTHPEGVAIICANNDDMAMAAARAAAGNDAYKDTIFMGFNGDRTACEAILKGELTLSVAQDAYGMGYKAVEAACQILDGTKLDRFVDSGAEIVNADNAQSRLDDLLSYLGK